MLSFLLLNVQQYLRHCISLFESTVTLLYLSYIWGKSGETSGYRKSLSCGDQFAITSHTTFLKIAYFNYSYYRVFNGEQDLVLQFELKSTRKMKSIKSLFILQCIVLLLQSNVIASKRIQPDPKNSIGNYHVFVFSATTYLYHYSEFFKQIFIF